MKAIHSSPHLLVIDDDEASCRLIRATFKAEGFDVSMAHDGPAGVERASADAPDVVLLDIRLPGLDGLQVLERLKAAAPWMPVVMLTASRDLKTAVRATQLGAFDYLAKPIDHDEILGVVRRALETRALRLEVEDLRRRVNRDEAGTLAAQMGGSAAVKQLVEQVSIVAASNFTVLVLGETGTGKELVAQAIHRQSERRRQPLIALDCGAIPESLLESELFGHEKGAFTGAERRQAGRFQLAQGGTCFLDEIGNLPLSPQAKLLRALESKQVQPVGAGRATSIDIRFIAATNDDLLARTHDGRFRADLYFRLAQYTIDVPPLRQRPDDIPYLAQRFLEEAGVELRRPVQQLLPGALELLQSHDWPGNVRELRNVVRQAVLRTTELVIRPADLRAAWSDARATTAAARRSVATSLKGVAEEAARAAERQAICAALRAAAGNQSRAAKALQTDYKTLNVKLKRLCIRARDFAP
jgi:DNA-binding NtrC family response regulator